MPVPVSTGYALNRTRHSYLARQLRVADTHWSRFCGLMGTGSESFPAGQGLWIVPSRGIHTFAMRFPIDVVYLDGDKVVVYLQENLKPWRLAPVRLRATSVLELPGNTLTSTQTAVGDEIEIGLGQAGQV
jgi:uncharacterized membrane protein (UPF0127 family)